ncbi:hypothetical protein HY440_03170 [Candidatus Microgenomates bacterium]|nr:hypothetical protein [Candidatus Microgenomates bacterium]
MAIKASIVKKFRRWVNRKAEASKTVYQKSALSMQVGKLLQSRGSEIITMTTL